MAAIAIGFAAVLLYLQFFAAKPAPAAAPGNGNAGSAPAASHGSRPAAGDAASRAGSALAKAPTVKTPEFQQPAGPAAHLRISNSKINIKASARGAKLLSVRLPGYGLEYDSPPEDRKNPEKSLELIFHSGAPVSGLSLFLDSGPYRDPSHPLRPLLGALETGDWEMKKLDATEAQGEGVEWKLFVAPLEFVKTFRLDREGYHGTLSIEVAVRDDALERSRDASASLHLMLVPGAWVFGDHDQFAPSPSAFAGHRLENGSVTVETQVATLTPGLTGAANPAWSDFTQIPPDQPGQPKSRYTFFADSNKYFAAGVIPSTPFTSDAIYGGKTLKIAVTNHENRPEARIASVAMMRARLPVLGKPVRFEFKTYFGPKEYDALAVAPELREIHNYERGSFLSPGWLSDGIAALLRLFHGLLGNWGFSIIILTICLRAAMFPITRRSQVTMADFAAKQAAIKPKLEELTKKFKDNPKKLNEERFRLFKENNVPIAPPLGGCLPVFLNIPIFVGFFSALRTMFELRHEAFGFWVHDLARPDQVVAFAKSFSLPLVGEVRGLNILPILMIAMWIANQYVTQKNMPQSNDAQQKFTQRFTMILTVVMGLGLYNYASGLSVYSITSSTVTLLEQTLIRKYWPPKAHALPAPAPGGGSKKRT